jgi:hypothetical protein
MTLFLRFDFRNISKSSFLLETFMPSSCSHNAGSHSPIFSFDLSEQTTNGDIGDSSARLSLVHSINA